MTVERRKLLLVGRDEQGLRVVAADALQALEALLDPEDHLPFPHPSGECPGECQEVRRVLGVGEAAVPVPHHLSTWERDIRLTALRDALEVVDAYRKEQEEARVHAGEVAHAKQQAADELFARIGKLCLAPGSPVPVGGGHPLEVEVSTAQAEASFIRLGASMDGAAEASKRLAATLTHVETVLGKLRSLGGDLGGITLTVAGDVTTAHTGDPRLRQALEVVRQVKSGDVSAAVALLLFDVLGVNPNTAEAWARVALKEKEEATKPASFVPDPALVAQAESDWEGAQQDEKDDAARLYERLIARPGRRSAVSGASLPSLPQCSALVRAGWLDVAREVRNWVA